MGEAVDVLEWHIGNSLCRRGNVWFVCEQEKSRKTKATHKEIMLEFLPFYSVHAIHICRWWRQKISFNTIANSWACYKVEKYSLKAKTITQNSIRNCLIVFEIFLVELIERAFNRKPSIILKCENEWHASIIPKAV